jgi:hypothetical protein
VRTKNFRSEIGFRFSVSDLTHKLIFSFEASFPFLQTMNAQDDAGTQSKDSKVPDVASAAGSGAAGAGAARNKEPKVTKKEKSEKNEKISALPYSITKAYLAAVCALHDIHHIVSVGSGNGRMEHLLEQENDFKGQTFICVDPEPESYSKFHATEVRKPEYATVKDLIADHSNAAFREKPLKGSTTCLFLNWPSPSASVFDIEAVESLQPAFVVMVYEQFGGAAGQEMHKALHSMYHKPKGWPGDFTPAEQQGNDRLKNYFCLAHYYKEEPNLKGMLVMLTSPHLSVIAERFPDLVKSFFVNRDGIILLKRKDISTSAASLAKHLNPLPSTAYHTE